MSFFFWFFFVFFFFVFFFFFQEEDGIRDWSVTGVQRCALPIFGQGIPATRLRVVGYGATRPVADNATAAGREMNRRVDLSFNLSQPLTDQFPSLSIGALTKIGRASCRERVGCAERDGG